MIASESAQAGDPGKGSLDDPSLGQDLKACWKEAIPINLLSDGNQDYAFGYLGSLDRLHRPSQVFFHPVDEFAP